MSIMTTTLVRSWVAAIPAALLALAAGSLLRALLIGAVVFAVVETVVFLLTYLQTIEKRRWENNGRPTGTGAGSISGITGVPTSYIGGHYPADEPGEGGEFRRGAIHGSPDPEHSTDRE